ncbi:sugar/nucleoside kinase (ribokinase family) [Thermocatellispora tengchongensis]|uniref:Sugar/nucleoside kinase (Ribokinase family) n=1 Tax=Thermocatellispora tengchongensis TaxID=1073253 RepID=A0A840P5A9_9ACTN|nr:sugar kinase [Thermocatellispora tengchongensis]MBB5131215.1 sugar/nucleoside kinase (ribokinase family) [Thermocatellispora tengchongensis]
MGGLLVIGDVVTDVVARHATAAGIAAGTDTEADIAVRPGGSGANTAAWAAHLGAEAHLLARVGYDTAEWHRAELLRAGVRPHLRVDPATPTAVVIAMVDDRGERSMLTNRGASRMLEPRDWVAGLTREVDLLHISAYVLFEERGRELARLAIAEADRHGVRISVDPASTGPLSRLGVDRFLAETAPASLIVPNLDEARLLSGADDPERAAEVLSARYGTAVVKLGGLGALLARDGNMVAGVPAVTVEVIDSTGAGDAFAAGYLTASLAGAEDVAAVAAGCRAGAQATTNVGGRPLLQHSPVFPANQLYPIDTN